MCRLSVTIVNAVMQNVKSPRAGPPMMLGNMRELGLALILGFNFNAEARAAEAVYLACSGTLTISLKSQDLPAREEPWTVSLAVDADKKAVTIDDTSMPIMSDASENIIAFRSDPAADPGQGRRAIHWRKVLPLWMLSHYLGWLPLLQC